MNPAIFDSRDYVARHNDCRKCQHLRKPTLTEYFINRYEKSWCVGVCTAPGAINNGECPVSHDENQNLPCSMYQEAAK